MRFVPVKSEVAQSHLAVHTVRQGWVSARTAVINRLRGLLSEFGIVLPQKAATVRIQAIQHLESLPGWMKTACLDLLQELRHLDDQVDRYDQHIKVMASVDERARRLMKMPGIGPTTASALLASIGYGHDFSNGRQLAAWLGLVPCQYSSGGKNRLGRITKAGDGYLRMLLVMGARAVLSAAATSTIGSLAGLSAWPNGVVMEKPLLPSRPRMHAWLGPCWPEIKVLIRHLDRVTVFIRSKLAKESIADLN